MSIYTHFNPRPRQSAPDRRVLNKQGRWVRTDPQAARTLAWLRDDTNPERPEIVELVGRYGR